MRYILLPLLTALLVPNIVFAQGTINVRAERNPIDKLFADIEKQTGQGFRVSREIEPLRLTVLIKDMSAQTFRDLTKQALHLSWEERKTEGAPGEKAWFLYRSARNAEEERQMRELPVRQLRNRLEQYIKASQLNKAELEQLKQTDPTLANMFLTDERMSTGFRFLGTLPSKAIDRVASGKALGFPVKGTPPSSPLMQAASTLMGGARIVTADGASAALAISESFNVSGNAKDKTIGFGVAGGNFSMSTTTSISVPDNSDKELSPFRGMNSSDSELEKSIHGATAMNVKSAEEALLTYAEKTRRNLIAEWFPYDMRGSFAQRDVDGNVVAGPAPQFSDYLSFPRECVVVENTMLVQTRGWYDLRLGLITEELQTILDKLFEKHPFVQHEAWLKASELTYEQAKVFRSRRMDVLHIFERTMYGVLQLEAHLSPTDRERILSERGAALSSLGQKGRAAVATLLQAADDDGKLVHPLPPQPNIWLTADSKKPGPVNIVLRNRDGDVILHKAYLLSPLQK